jgi:hypothetical protein
MKQKTNPEPFEDQLPPKQKETLGTVLLIAETKYSYATENQILAETTSEDRKVKHFLSTLVCKGFLNLDIDGDKRKYIITQKTIDIF